MYLLIDSRHKPSDNDIMMYEWIVSQGVTPIIVATKTDKLKRSQIKGQMELIMKTLNLTSKEQLLPFSSETKVGVNELWEIIEGIYPEQESLKGVHIYHRSFCSTQHRFSRQYFQQVPTY